MEGRKQVAVIGGDARQGGQECDSMIHLVQFRVFQYYCNAQVKKVSFEVMPSSGWGP